MATHDTEPVIFKTEDSLWQMLADGSKKWDARKFDLEDPRIHRLALHLAAIPSDPYDVSFTPVEPHVGFINKKTREVLVFEFKGLEFPSGTEETYMKGWVLIFLGNFVSSYKGQERL